MYSICILYRSGYLQSTVNSQKNVKSKNSDFIISPFLGIFIHVFTFITKTCLYNFDPLKSHFYIVKLGFTGVYIIFLISAQNIDCGYSLEPPRRGGFNEYSQSMFWYEKYQIFSIWKPYLLVKFSKYLNRRVFVMYLKIYQFYWPLMYLKKKLLYEVLKCLKGLPFAKSVSETKKLDKRCISM